MGACLSSFEVKASAPPNACQFIALIRFCPFILFPVCLASTFLRSFVVSVVSQRANPHFLDFAICDDMPVLVIDLLRLHQGNDTQQLKWL
jgi:hypothetical protein